MPSGTPPMPRTYRGTHGACMPGLALGAIAGSNRKREHHVRPGSVRTGAGDRVRACPCLAEGGFRGGQPMRCVDCAVGEGGGFPSAWRVPVCGVRAPLANCLEALHPTGAGRWLTGPADDTVSLRVRRCTDKGDGCRTTSCSLKARSPSPSPERRCCRGCACTWLVRRPSDP